MPVSLIIEWFVAILLILTCISHILHPKLWAEFFIDLLRWRYGGLIIGILTVQTGLLVVLGHNIWEWDLSVIVTIIGWAWTVKGGLYLVAPQLPHMVSRRHLQHPERFVMAGIIGLALGAAVLVDLLSRAA